MNDCKVVTLVSLATYGFFFVVILFLALTLSSEEKSDYASALFLIFTTFFAGSWGHITPNFEVGRAVCSLTAMLGYMYPLVAAFFMFVCMSQDSLAFMAAKAFWLAYFCTALLANFILAAGLSADCLAAEESWMSEKCDYGSQLYFAWMTFHLRAYGEVAPTGPGSNFISLIIVMFGSLCWVVPLFTVARICFGIIMLFAVLWAAMCSGGCYDAACIDCDFGNVFHVLLSTFHGATWGHLYPRWPFEQFLACVVASMGYLWRQVVLLLLLLQIDQHQIALKYAKALLVTYFLFAVLGNLIVSGLNTAAAEAEENWGYGNILYYTWMSYHGRAYGEYYPMGAAQEFLACVMTATGHLEPRTLVVRRCLRSTSLRMSDVSESTAKLFCAVYINCVLYLCLLLEFGCFTEIPRFQGGALKEHCEATW